MRMPRLFRIFFGANGEGVANRCSAGDYSLRELAIVATGEQMTAIKALAIGEEYFVEGLPGYDDVWVRRID